MKIKFALTYAAALLLAACAFSALADERVDRIEQAWNSGDQAATQKDFAPGAFRSAAELGALVEGSLKVSKVARLNDRGALGVGVEVNGVPEVWVIEECADDPRRFCYFGHRQVEGLGGAERGQAADVGTTLTAISLAGAVEANPMGLAFILPMKAGFLVGSRQAAFDECVAMRTSLDAFGWGGGVANAVTMVATVTSIGVPLGILAATAWLRWDAAAEGAMYECAGFALSA